MDGFEEIHSKWWEREESTAGRHAVAVLQGLRTRPRVDEREQPTGTRFSRFGRSLFMPIAKIRVTLIRLLTKDSRSYIWKDVPQ